MRIGRVVLLLLAFSLASGCLSGPLTGKPAPAFELVTSDGRLVNETTYLGQYVILDLMATWCGPCKLEVAHLREVKATHGDDVVILSIGVDGDETIADLERFGTQYGADWPYAIDRQGEMQRTMRMKIIPKLVIIDPEGLVVFEREGEVLPSAITRVIDPSSAPSPGFTWLGAFAAVALGFLAPFNPYRRVHRELPHAGPTLGALGLFVVLAFLAWPFSALASSRATYGSLFIGVLTLLAAGWWVARARRRVPVPGTGSALAVTSDRAYEMAPHFVGALVLSLASVGAAGFFIPLAAFFVGASTAFLLRARVPPARAESLGLAGLVMVGVGLLIFGARILLVR